LGLKRHLRREEAFRSEEAFKEGNFSKRTYIQTYYAIE